MKATASELSALARNRQLTIVLFPVRGAAVSLPPLALQKKFDADFKIEFDTTGFEIRVREAANVVAPQAAAA